MIELIQLHKTYSSPGKAQIVALRDVSLSVKKGEILGVIGESGAGKSTLIRCVNRLENPESGQVIVDGQDLMQLNKSQLRTARRNIGMIFQHFNLLSSRSVAQNIAFPLELAGYNQQRTQKRIDELLEITGLGDRRNHYPSELSGGQKQRVAIARALANHPKVLLSDEATSALDVETRHNILQLLKKINQEFSLTILLITHEMSVIKEICHRLAVLEDGKIATQDEVLNFFSQPKTAVAKKYARAEVLHSLPENIQKRLVDVVDDSALPLWRLSFVGEAAETPHISHLAREYSLQLNILQAHVESIRDDLVGMMLVEAVGNSEQMQRGKEYLTNQGIFVEEIGYVRPVH